MTDYNPEHCFSVNARDEIALRAPLPGFIFQPKIVALLCGLKSEEDIKTIRDIPLAIARWNYLYSDAMILARSEIPDETLRKEFFP